MLDLTVAEQETCAGHLEFDANANIIWPARPGCQCQKEMLARVALRREHKDAWLARLAGLDDIGKYRAAHALLDALIAAKDYDQDTAAPLIDAAIAEAEQAQAERAL